MKLFENGLVWVAALAAILAAGACQAAPKVESVATFAKQNPKMPAPVVTAAAINVAGKDVAGTEMTFAQPFVPGDVPAGESLQAMTLGGQKLPTQVDWKASNKDGSRRHGIFTVALPAMKQGERIAMGFYPAAGRDSRMRASGPESLPEQLSARIVLTIEGEKYTTSLDKLAASGIDRLWLSGPLVKEWQVSGPVANDAGEPHDRIWVQFYVRHYSQSGRTRLEAIVDNSWAFQSRARNVTYGATLFLNGTEVYSARKLSHTDHARWRKVFWSQGGRDLYPAHDLAYLKATGAIPNYDPDIRVPRAAVSKLYQRYRKSPHGPMERSIVHRYMPATGGRPDIGPLPAWTVLRLLTMDPRLVFVNEGIGSTSGSWPIHLRDKNTKRPVSLDDHPNLSTHPNVAGRRNSPLPDAEYGEHPNKFRPDVNHEPSLAFVPYLLTGDYYYLEELQFWAAWDPLRTSPSYRGKEKGLVGWLQVRGQAWAMRTLGQTAYITPDDHPMKAYWTGQLQNNIAWYNAHYAKDPDANELGFLVGRMPYNEGRGVAPWQDDFFTWAMGYLVDLGFESARPMLEYKARFPVGRMTAPGYCWVLGAIYKLNVRDAENAPFYTDLGKAYKESASPKMQRAECASNEMASLLGKNYKKGDMSGYPSSPQGFPANMQPALAAAVDAQVPDARQAWTIFMNRSTKPDYGDYPNWAILPDAARNGGEARRDSN